MVLRTLLTVCAIYLGLWLPWRPLTGDGPSPANAAPETVEFQRSIRPILSNNCFKCHGLDAGERKAGLRLDRRQDALKPTDSGKRAVVPGKPGESALVSRVFSSDEDFVMPPPESGKKLTALEKELLRRWIEEGAEYQEHWAFLPPRRPALPEVSDRGWCRNEVDRFVLARLEKEGLRPSPEALRTFLIRRLTLDLTGLPPTPAQVDAYLADPSPEAYEKVVDRLLASPRYGERMALDWLDVARFADTNGYHIDNGRDMTWWREWVIQAFNRNLPFDRFTIEQLAGDLLPEPTVEERIASGFNRNHMINFEGGAIPEEYHAAYIVDRVNTTTTVWMGLTLACSQCHDHKYDPISQKEYYQLYAFFHNVPENGLDGQKGNSAPFLKLPTPEQGEALARLSESIQKLDNELSGPLSEVDAAQAEWEKAAALVTPAEWALLEPTDLRSTGGATLTRLEDGSILAGGQNPAVESYGVVARTELKEVTAVRLEALADDRLPAKGPGRSSNGNFVLTGVALALKLEGGVSRPVKLKTASADFSQKDFPVSAAIDEKSETGWAIHPEVGKPHAAVFEAEEPIRLEEAGLFAVTLEFQSALAQHQAGRFRLSVTTSRDPHGKDVLPVEVRELLAVAPEKRTEDQRAKLRSHYRTKVSPETKRLHSELQKLRQSLADLEKQVATSMVMEEMPQPRDTFILVRGQYDKRGEKVSAGVPAFLPPLPPGARTDRLGLARWLVDPSHPLTSRVAANRSWQMLFGTGLVKTSEDFGSQGEPPSHPELLDWLAVEFMARGWDIKAFLRLIVTSSTYRQSSAATPELLERDPENRLLARGARFRLPAEFIRDQALALSGLLDDRIGGPSVSPYQPPGLWEELAYRDDGSNWTAQTYVQSKGHDLYRRSMYTFWKRTSPPPTLATFDAPDRETCTVRRARTNTPLQALILLNDPTYLEASRKLAERMMVEACGPPGDRITFAFRLATARRPNDEEVGILLRAHQEALEVYRRDGPAALKLLSAGESGRDALLDPGELAAWTVVASMILNLDETLTRG